MTKLLLNYLLIYAIITVSAAILILWVSRKDKHILLIITGAGAIAILLFYLFYLSAGQAGIPALNTAKPPQPAPLSEAMVGSTPEAAHREALTKLPKQTQSEPLINEPKGPFQTDETVSTKERQIGRLFNIWRQSVLTRNISQINQLDSQIKACGDEAIPFLTELAQSDGNERVRAFAARILGRQNKADLAPLFMELLKNDTSAFVRENSCWALGRLGNTESLEILQKVAESDSSAPVRQAATAAIENIKSSRK